MERALIIMTRVPVAGETKTRLMPNLSGEECVALHEAFLKDLIRLQEGLQVPTYIYYSGDLTEKFTRMFPREVKFLPQIGSDLGARMAQAFRQTLISHKDVVMIGSDVPNLTVTCIEKAFKVLEDEKDLVFGPALDGGYYLIGMNAFHPELFEGISWGGNGVLEKTLERVQEKISTYSLLKMMRDLDRVEDLEAYIKSGENSPTCTWQVIQEILGCLNSRKAGSGSSNY